MDLKTAVGHTATVCTVGLFMTGIDTCLKIRSKGTTVGFSAFPFIAGFISASLWLQYGVLVEDNTVISVNLIGALLQASYIVWYYIYTFNRTLLHKQLVVVFCFMGIVFSYVMYLVEDEKAAINFAGLVACGAVLTFFGSPLISLADVIKTRSVENLPFLLILSSFVVSSLWVFYGVLVSDSFIQLPNFLGALLAGFQLVLYAIFSRRERADLNLSKG